MKHRALIIGAGRMGAGYKFGGFPYIYDHASTYLALKDRVELVGFVEEDQSRSHAAREKYGVPFFFNITAAIDTLKPNIISVCTPDDTHTDVLRCIVGRRDAKGIWMEKPFPTMTSKFWIPTQVNYCRRFDFTHQRVAEMLDGRKNTLTVWARNDLTTRCHFEDLARWWKSDLVYMDNTGESPSTNSYRVDCGKWAVEFRNGGIEGDFMVNALSNLLDVVDGVPGAVLLSPPYVESGK